MSLKDWMKKVESAQLNEFATNGQIQIKPASQMPKTPGQQPTGTAPTGQQPAANQGQTNANTQVITQGNKTLGTVNNPQLAQQIKQSIGKGEMSLAGSQLGEDEMMEVAPPGMEDEVLALKKKFPGQEGRAYAIAWSNYNKKHGKSDTKESMMAESKQLNEGSLDEIIGNHPYEHKMCQEGWGMDESLYEALVDHYYKEGRIPKSLMRAAGEELRGHVESCYAKDTMVLGEADIDQTFASKDMVDEKSVTEGVDVISGLTDILKIASSRQSPPNPKQFAKSVADGAFQLIQNPATQRMSSYLKDLASDATAIANGTAQYTPAFATQVASVMGPAVRTYQDAQMNEGSKENFTMNARQADSRLDKYATDPKPSFLDKVGGAVKKVGSTVMNKLHPSDDELRSGPLEEESSELERMLRSSTKESTMFEGRKTKVSETTGVTDFNPKSQGGTRKELLAKYAKTGSAADATAARKAGATQDELKAAKAKCDAKSKVSEATTKTATGKIHKADPGGYGRKDDEEDKDEDGKKIKKAKKDEPAKGRGRPKKTDNTSGEDKKFDTGALNSMFGGKKPKKEIGKLSVKKRIATKADREAFDETLKGGQKKLDINKNGKIDGGDFAMLRGKKKKDAQMESWDQQLKGLLTESKQLNEGLTVSTSVGNEGGNDTVSITASDADAHQLLQLLQNAGMGSGVPGHAVQAAAAPATVLPKDGQPTVGSIANTDGAPNPSAQKDIEGGGDSVPIMAMPRGMLLSVNDETEMPTEPEEFGTLDQEEVVSALGSEQSAADDSGDDVLAAIKKLMGQHGGSEVSAPEAAPAEPKKSVEEADEDGKKPDEDGDGVPDWADKKPGKDDHAEDDKEEDKEDVKEGQQSCNECGGLMEDDHECGQLNEWANSPEGQSEDEQFEADIRFMTKTISGGLNGQKSTGQTTVPVIASQTNRQMSEGYNIDVAAEMRKLAGIR